jgi:hypothetical protein
VSGIGIARMVCGVPNFIYALCVPCLVGGVASERYWHSLLGVRCTTYCEANFVCGWLVCGMPCEWVGWCAVILVGDVVKLRARSNNFAPRRNRCCGVITFLSILVML